MVTMTTGGNGFNIDQIIISDLFLYDFSSLSGTTGFRVFDDAQNYTQFTGVGFATIGSPGVLSDVTAGTISTIIVVRQGAIILQITGASIPASAFFDTYVANDTTAAWNLALGGNDTITGTAFNDVLRGFGGNDTLNGGNGDDNLYGGIGNDTLNGGNGDNFFRGDAGVDVYNGGAGTGDNDYDVLGFHGGLGGVGVGLSVTMNTAGVLGGGAVTGTLASGTVNSIFTNLERVEGTEGSDTFIAGAGFANSSHSDFNWIGGGGNDMFNNQSNGNIRVNYDAEKFANEVFGNGNNIWGDAAGEFGVIVNRSSVTITVNIGNGNKSVAAGKALDTFGNTDTLIGTLGFKLTDTKDYYVAGNTGALFVQGRGGNDTLIGGTGNDEFDGGDGIDTISAGAGDDYLGGGAGNDILNGGAGDNFYEGSTGDDTYIGGVASSTNHDKISYERETGGVGIVVTFGLNGNVSVVDTYGNVETGTNIEEIKGSQYADRFNGSTGNDKAEGMGGNDVFNMGVGIDHLEYQHEVDAGATHGIILNMSAVTISANVGGGLFSVLAGKARDSFGSTDTLISVERVDGTNFTDYMVGSGLDDELNANNGNDTLFGGAGSDYLNGGGGGDSLFGGAGSDDFDGGDGAGIDYARYDDANYGNLTIRLDGIANVGAAALGDTYIGIEGLVGGLGNDTVAGNALANFLFGGGGNDFILGLGGVDYLNGGLGGDNLYGGAGADQHIGGDDAGLDFARYDDANHGNLVISLITPATNTGAALGDTYSGIEGLVGGLGNDVVIGNNSANYLFGSGGLDFIDALGGNDHLFGGASADKFRFSTALSAATNVDFVHDFVHSTDDLLLKQTIFASIGTALSATELRLGTVAADANDFIIYNSATGQIFYDANGNGAGGQTLFARVNAGTVLDAGDFVMV